MALNAVIKATKLPIIVDLTGTHLYTVQVLRSSGV